MRLDRFLRGARATRACRVQPHPAHRPQGRAAGERQARAAQGLPVEGPGHPHPAAQDRAAEAPRRRHPATSSDCAFTSRSPCTRTTTCWCLTSRWLASRAAPLPTAILDGMLGSMTGKDGQRPRLVHRLDKDTAGCLLVAKTRFAAAALATRPSDLLGPKIYWAWLRACRGRSRAASRPSSPRRSARTTASCASPSTAMRARATR